MFHNKNRLLFSLCKLFWDRNNNLYSLFSFGLSLTPPPPPLHTIIHREKKTQHSSPERVIWVDDVEADLWHWAVRIQRRDEKIWYARAHEGPSCLKAIHNDVSQRSIAWGVEAALLWEEVN